MFSHSEVGSKPKGHAGSSALHFSHGTAPGRGQVGRHTQREIFMAKSHLMASGESEG